jgi:hypothetical protein
MVEGESQVATSLTQEIDALSSHRHLFIALLCFHVYMKLIVKYVGPQVVVRKAERCVEWTSLPTHCLKRFKVVYKIINPIRYPPFDALAEY